MKNLHTTQGTTDRSILTVKRKGKKWNDKAGYIPGSRLYGWVPASRVFKVVRKLDRKWTVFFSRLFHISQQFGFVSVSCQSLNRFLPVSGRLWRRCFWGGLSSISSVSSVSRHLLASFSCVRSIASGRSFLVSCAVSSGGK